MKIIGKVKVYFNQTSAFDELRLQVKFKLPNQIFYRTKDKYLCSSCWTKTYDTYDDFLLDCKNKLSNIDYLKGVAKTVIETYIEDTVHQQIKINEIESLVKDINKQEFVIEVEIN